MHPELFRIGSFVLPTYGAALAVAFVAAVYLVRRRSGAFGFSADLSADFTVWVLLSGMLGAKILLLVVEWRQYTASPRAFFEILRAGGVFYGGLIGAILAGAVFIKIHHLDFWSVADAAAPVVALGQSIGRLGCLAAGCCWGRSCTEPWAITFTDPKAAENVGVPLGVPLHPTQLYESFGVLLLAGALVAFERRRFPGQTFARYLIGYSLIRGTIEFFRGDPRGSLLNGALSTSQFIALVGLVAGIAILALRRRLTAAPTPA